MDSEKLHDLLADAFTNRTERAKVLIFVLKQWAIQDDTPDDLRFAIVELLEMVSPYE